MQLQGGPATLIDHVTEKLKSRNFTFISAQSPRIFKLKSAKWSYQMQQ
jgi:hypothetical protein